MLSDMSPAGRYDKFSPDDEAYPPHDAPKKATGVGSSSAPSDTSSNRLGCLPNVAYHMEHLHSSPRGLVGVFERNCHISIRDFGIKGGIERKRMGDGRINHPRLVVFVRTRLANIRLLV